jgi:chromosome segregation ATPase
MDWIAILNGAAGAGVLAVVIKIIDLYLNRNKPKIDNAEAATKLIEGGAQAVKVMRELLDDYDKRDEKKDAKIEKLEQWKTERERLGYLRDAEHADLQQKYEDLEAHYIKLQNQQRDTAAKYQQDLEETQRLRNDYANSQKQIIKLEDLAISLGEYVDKIKTAVQKAGIDLPLNGELLDSVMRLKFSREERRRLLGDK